MKKSIPSLRNLVMIVALFLPAWSITVAQQPTGQDEVKVKIEKHENGETVIIEETVPAGKNGNSIDAILQQYGIDTEFGDLKDNEEVEIIIRRKTEEAVYQDVRIVLDPEQNSQFPTSNNNFQQEKEGKPLLGVYFENGISQQRAAELGLTDRSVAYVTSVIAGTGAEKANMQAGDVITAVDGMQIRPGVDLRDLIGAHKPGDKVVLSILRDGKNKKVKAILGEKKPERPQASPNLNYDLNNGQSFSPFAPNNKEGIASCRDMNNSPFLGITGSPTDGAVTVTGVVPNSTALKIGLKAADVITMINGSAVGSWEGLVNTISSSKVGEEVKVSILRDGNKLELKGILQNRNGETSSGAVTKTLSKEISILIKMENVTPEEVAIVNKGAEAGGLQAENNLQASELDFYPNPNDGRFNLSFSLPEEGNTNVRIFDLNGTTVYEESLLNFSGRFVGDIDISKYSKGIYFLQVEQNGRSLNKKIVTQ